MTQARLIQDFPFQEVTTCISRGNTSSSTGEASRVGAHDSILEAGAEFELSSAPLEGDAVFEGPRGHYFAVLQRDELDSAESAREHLAEVGKDARIHPGGAGVFARFHVSDRSTHNNI